MTKRRDGWRLAVHARDEGGLALHAEARLAPEDEQPWLDFLRAAAAGRRAIFTQAQGPLRLYADPRPGGGARLTVEWDAKAHATYGLTLSAGELAQLLPRPRV
ncbi:MAG: hypothetical protein IMW98_01090 [Firmicutes bacterium]|nr:hypothetical protein [Bacillota bacterium]